MGGTPIQVGGKNHKYVDSLCPSGPSSRWLCCFFKIKACPNTFSFAFRSICINLSISLGRYHRPLGPVNPFPLRLPLAVNRLHSSSISGQNRVDSADLLSFNTQAAGEMEMDPIIGLTAINNNHPKPCCRALLPTIAGHRSADLCCSVSSSPRNQISALGGFACLRSLHKIMVLMDTESITF